MIWNRLSLPNFERKTCFETVELALGRALFVFNPFLAVTVREGKEEAVASPALYREGAQRSRCLPRAVRSEFLRLPGKSAKTV